MSADRGARRRVESVGAPSGAREALPVIRHQAPEAGPTVAITANVHGDEVTGVAAVHALDEVLPLRLIRGVVLLYPSLNPRGLKQQQRVQPDDGVDLNRVFPGDAAGRGTSQVAGLVWADLAARRPDALLDLHSDSPVSVPYVIVDRATHLTGAARESMDHGVAALAEATGLTVLHEYPDEQYVRFRLDRSLAGAMVNHASVPALTLEIGPRRAVDPEAVRVTVAALLGALHHLGLVADPPLVRGPRIAGGPWRRAAAPRVQAPGLFLPALAPGERFRTGDLLGAVRAVDGTVRELIRAEADGIVISWSEAAWLDARGVPGTLGLEERR